mgnify:FL=1|jgi:hypothetical protein|tara:strand:- start:85 stop:318 length:234 start_codon:yes stop_codon:yes gene_type:complete
MDLEFQILKIVGYKTWSDKKKIDAMLEIDSNNYTNLGKESLQKEKDLVKKQSRFIYRAIKSVDESVGNLLYKTRDRK